MTEQGTELVTGRMSVAERFAQEFIGIRGAHNPMEAELDADQEALPCAWCRLAGEQAAAALEAMGVFLTDEYAEATNAAMNFGDGAAEARRLALAEGLTFAAFAATNRARCEAPDGFGHPLNGWSLSDWMLAATGEFGEAANVAKKLNRVRDGIPGNTQTPEELRAALADEFADAVIYLDLAAQASGFSLGEAIASKFNRTSEKIGAPHRLSEEARHDPQ